MCEEFTGFNKLAFRVVESKGLPVGRPAGPESDPAFDAELLKMGELQALASQRLMLSLVEACCELVNPGALAVTNSSTPWP